MGAGSYKLGFTVGVWDLWHIGHVNCLKQARTHCDYLIVGIMTDYWVKVQKGHDRPYQPLEERIRSLEQSGLADKIVVLDTLDMTPYLQMVDVWIKGEDQRNMRTSYYPSIEITRRTPGISTTQLGG